MEIKYFPLFIYGSLKYLLIAVYVVSIATLTVYAVWYIASFITFYSIGSLKPQKKPSKWPKVAIVIPVHNDYEVLSSLRKVLELKYSNFFTVVVDDSTDEWLVKELSKISRRSRGKIVHLRRNRRGLKAGALNDAIRFLEKHGVDYVLFLDADFEPEPDMVRKAVELALQYDADVVQGYQRHVKGSHGVFGIVYRASQGGAIVNIVGRQHLGLFPFFTGSCALIRYSMLRKIPFVENSLSEDLRWTIDAMLKHPNLKIVASHEVYANGSVPKTQKAFIRQQIRWSFGTLREFMQTFSLFVLSRKIDWLTKLGFIHQGLFYTQGIWIYANLLAPLLLHLFWNLEIGPLWPLGIYVWFIGFETIILSGSLLEKYSKLDSLIVALAVLPMLYYVSLLHTYGTLKALFSRKASWTVTSKKGRYEVMYGE